MRVVIVLKEAAEDLEKARDFYDNSEPGAGDYCVDSLVADIQTLSRLHGVHAVHFRCFRMLASRFPFGIYYQDSNDTTGVVAVLDLRRDPGWIRSELSGRTG